MTNITVMDGSVVVVMITAYLLMVISANRAYCTYCPQEVQVTNYCIPKNLTKTIEEVKLSVIALVCYENWTSAADLKHVCFRPKTDQSGPLTPLTHGIFGASAGIALIIIIVTPILVRINLRLSRIEKRMAVRSSLDAIYRRRLFPSSCATETSGSLLSQQNNRGAFNVTPYAERKWKLAHDKAQSVLNRIGSESSDSEPESPKLYEN